MDLQTAKTWVEQNRPDAEKKLATIRELRDADKEGRVEECKAQLLAEAANDEHLPTLRESARKLKADVQQTNKHARADREAQPEFTVGQAWGLLAAALIIPSVIGLFWDPGFLGTLRVLMFVAAAYGIYAAYRDRNKAKKIESANSVGSTVDTEREGGDRAA